MFNIYYFVTVCCDYDIDTETCDSSNYFSLYYGNSVSYNSGFLNNYRKEIAFLKYNNEIKKKKDSISIAQNEKLDVKFVYPINNLNGFFSSDNNMKNYLVSLDFSNFDSSQITSMGNAFNGLTSLKYIDLSGFGPSLTSMN